MRILIFAVIALIVIGGAGAGGYYYFSGNEAEASGGEVGQNHANHKAETEEDKSHYSYVELDPLILPIIDNNGVAQVVSVVVALETTDAKKAAEIELIAPRIKDAFIQDMYGVLNRHAALKGGVIQVNELKKRLNIISEKVAGEDKINDVLLQVVQQRPI